MKNVTKGVYYGEVKAAGYRMVTSDYVLDEVIIALFRSVAFSSAVQFIDSLFSMINLTKIKYGCYIE